MTNNELIGLVSSWNVTDADACKTVLGELFAAVQDSEPGTALYQAFTEKDGTTLTFHESLADNDAALAHMNGVGLANFALRLVAYMEPASQHVYGDVSDAMREAITAWGPHGFHASAGGFNRLSCFAPQRQARFVDRPDSDPEFAELDEGLPQQ